MQERGVIDMTAPGQRVSGAARVQAVRQWPAPRRETAVWAGGLVALLALALWLRWLAVPWLAVAAFGALVCAAGAVRRRLDVTAAGALTLCIAVGFAALAQQRLHEIARDWPAVRSAVEQHASDALRGALDDLVDRGERGVDGAARLAALAPRAPAAALFSRLEQLRAGTGLTALVIYGPEGAPLAWAGEHRGRLPDSVRSGARDYTFHDGPLFGFLYFARPLEGGRTAVAAVLLDAAVAAGGAPAPFADRFASRHGIRPRFMSSSRARGDAVWDWATDHPILSVSFAALTPERWRDRTAQQGRWIVGGLWAATLALLFVGWYRRRAGHPGVPIAAATMALLIVPWGAVVGAEGLFSPLRFVLAGPAGLSLGALLILLAGAALVLLTFTPAHRWTVRLPGWARSALAALVLLVVPGAIHRSAAESAVATGFAGGVALQLAAALLFGVPLFLLLGRAPRARGGGGARLVALALAGAVVLAAAWVTLWQPTRPVPLSAAVVWAVPFALAALGLARTRGAARTRSAWFVAGWMAATLALPLLWSMHQEARLAQAEAELARLGTEADPFLDFLLRQFADRVQGLAIEGEDGANLLYRAWVVSGLAREGYEARLTLWTDGQRAAELPLTDVDLPAHVVSEVLGADRAAGAARLERYTTLESLHYLLIVPLADGRTVTVAVPPRRRLARSTALARLLQPAVGTAADDDARTLTLIPLATAGEAAAEAAAALPAATPVEWVRTAGGWRSEARVHFPAGPMDAHLLVRSAPPSLLVVRLILSFVLVLLVWAVLWAAARTLCGEPFGLPAARRGWLRSFRGRLVLALLAFFLAPTLALGAVAYGALSREVVRTAAGVATWSLERAAPEQRTVPLAVLGSRLHADFLLYRHGALAEASAPEVIDLGLFQSWLSPEIYLDFRRDEDVQAVEERTLGGQEYLVAYRRLPSRDVLAVPTPLAAGEIARRQREFADLLLLICLAGGALSAVLSLFVGRALSRPIEQLSRAALAVGGGDLGVRLPGGRADEFSGVYRAFNRMVQRLRSARLALLRETRRTEAILAEAGTGVLALDVHGHVALVNPRARDILGVPLAIGARLPDTGALVQGVAAVVRDFLGSDDAEHGTEIERDGRIVRVRLRRLPGSNVAGGAVLALEDITDEIRTARVLAWGEMARQVAHEIKNPLTPIKLAVQHLRRAWADGRPDYDAILARNVEAVLREIDRLSDIARAFARFGAPGAAAGAVEPVDLRAVAEETLALYRSGGPAGIRYEVTADAATPAAYARVGELKEVLVNLLENAREAVGGKGTIAIHAAPGIEAGRVVLEVRDDGEGIAPEMLSRIFDPHFSTRTRGTGLGLAIVRRLVESWGGEIGVDSQPGAGTTIRMRLNAAET